MRWRRPIRTAIVAPLLAVVPLDHPVARDSGSTEAVRRQAFELSYNLDRGEALALLRKAAAEHPSDPGVHRALASVLWMAMLFARGAVTVDHYLGSFSRTQVELSKPPADLDAEFRKHVTLAIQLAEARVAAAPGDAQARYDLGAAVGLEASHIATVQGRMFAGFKAAQRAFDEHERVLAIDASRMDARLIVGTYRYVVSTLSLPLRMMAYVVGFGGGRERGIEMVQEAARGGESQTDAMFALVLLYNREKRYDDALRVLADLRRRHPRNRLVVLEAGSTALRAGRAAQAEALLTEGLDLVAKERRPLIPGEQALWRYKRGAARVALGNVAAARADLSAAIGPGAQDWVRGRAHAELARIAMRGGDHAGARTEAMRAESLCRQGSDEPCVAAARRLARSAGGH
jgi:tetratricopeptide (TPR) repeat protein